MLDNTGALDLHIRCRDSEVKQGGSIFIEEGLILHAASGCIMNGRGSDGVGGGAVLYSLLKEIRCWIELAIFHL